MTDELSDIEIQRLYENATAAMKQNQADQAVADLLNVVISKLNADTVKFNRILNQINDAIQQRERRFADLENRVRASYQSGLENSDILNVIEARLDSIEARIGIRDGKTAGQKGGTAPDGL